MKQKINQKINMIALMIFLMCCGVGIIFIAIFRQMQMNEYFYYRLLLIFLVFSLCVLIAFVGQIVDRERGIKYQ
jgi:hypothetical protein